MFSHRKVEREDMTFTQQRSPNEEDTCTSRSIKQRNMLVKNLCENFAGFTGAFPEEFRVQYPHCKEKNSVGTIYS